MSTIHRFAGDMTRDINTWKDIEPKLIQTEEVQAVLKNVLVGPDDGAPDFVIRYFHVPVGDNTFFDQHDHEQGIVILHGKAKVQINDDFHELGPLDAIFISGGDIHKLVNIGDTPLGFFCVITRQVEYA